MSNPLFSILNGSQGGASPQGYNNPMQMLQALRSDPVGLLRGRGLNIPDGMTNPQQIINHLLQSGQVPQGRYQQALQMAQQFKR